MVTTMYAKKQTKQRQLYNNIQYSPLLYTCTNYVNSDLTLWLQLFGHKIVFLVYFVFKLPVDGDNHIVWL